MAERFIPDNDAQKFTTIDGRKELMLHTAVVNGHGCGAERPSCVA